MFDYMNYLKIFAGKTLADQVNLLGDLCLANGFTESVGLSRGGIYGTTFYEKDGVENVYAVTSSCDHHAFQMIMANRIVDKFFRDGSEYMYVGLNTHSYKGRSVSAVVRSYDGKNNVKLHRLIMKEYGCDPTGWQVDHRAGHPGINIIEELRRCTCRQNNANKPGSKVTDAGEFIYDPDHDFRDTFWIYALHNPLGLITWEEMHDLNWMMRDLNKKIA